MAINWVVSPWQTHLTAQHIGPAVLELTASFRQHDVVWGAGSEFQEVVDTLTSSYRTWFEQVWKSLKYQISNGILDLPSGNLT
jgi:ABC-type cobalt transport system substrate-binding protein